MSTVYKIVIYDAFECYFTTRICFSLLDMVLEKKFVVSPEKYRKIE